MVTRVDYFECSVCGSRYDSHGAALKCKKEHQKTCKHEKHRMYLKAGLVNYDESTVYVCTECRKCKKVDYIDTFSTKIPITQEMYRKLVMSISSVEKDK